LYMPSDGVVSVKAYNIMGQDVSNLYNGIMSSGYTTLTWDASNLSSGMYIIRAISDYHVSSQKVMLIK